MLKSGRILSILFVLPLILAAEHLNAQGLWTNVSVNKSSVYVGEPVQVTISVYTETWFTRGIDIGNINVSGAFCSYFRPVSTSVKRDGKECPGVQLIYNVFPYVENDIIFPSLEIEVETPKVGDYKGVKHIVKSPQRRIQVKPIPSDMKSSDWLVASNLIVSERWSGSLRNVKVGDVLSRSVVRKASGTVAELIPPSVWDSLTDVSTYPGKSSINTFKTKTSISSQREESVSYLFEKEGTVVIPERIYTWYNPVSKKLYKRTLKAETVEVKANSDLGMLSSIRDSLQMQQQEIEVVETSAKPLLILGLSPRNFALALISVLVLCYFLLKTIKHLLRSVKSRREAYLHSEAYYFDKLKGAIRRKREAEIVNALYRWIDELQLDEPTFKFLQVLVNDVETDISGLTVDKLKSIRMKHLRQSKEVRKNRWIAPF